MTRYWFISPRYRRDTKLILFTCALAFVVILLGAYTRLTDAGLSCPDWPQCYGYLTAPHTDTQIQSAIKQFPTTPVNTKKAWTEMTHRYLAGTEGILILIVSFSFLFSKKNQDLKSNLISVGLIALLFVQVMLGMLTVTAKLKPVIVLSHLVTGLSILSFLWLLYLNLQTPHFSSINTKIKKIIPLCWIALFCVIAQITLGGWVSTHYAGLACIDFPYCNGNLIPTLQWHNWNSDLITIHMLHRFGAAITASFLLIFSCALVNHKSYRSLAFLILALISLQVTLGILNIVWLRPVWIALLHQAVATIILLTTITILIKAYFESRETWHGLNMA